MTELARHINFAEQLVKLGVWTPEGAERFIAAIRGGA